MYWSFARVQLGRPPGELLPDPVSAVQHGSGIQACDVIQRGLAANRACWKTRTLWDRSIERRLSANDWRKVEANYQWYLEYDDGSYTSTSVGRNDGIPIGNYVVYVLPDLAKLKEGETDYSRDCSLYNPDIAPKTAMK